MRWGFFSSPLFLSPFTPGSLAPLQSFPTFVGSPSLSGLPPNLQCIWWVKNTIDPICWSELTNIENYYWPVCNLFSETLMYRKWHFLYRVFYQNGKHLCNCSQLEPLSCVDLWMQWDHCRGCLHLQHCGNWHFPYCLSRGARGTVSHPVKFWTVDVCHSCPCLNTVLRSQTLPICLLTTISSPLSQLADCGLCCWPCFCRILDVACDT